MKTVFVELELELLGKLTVLELEETPAREAFFLFFQNPFSSGW
jgi:hypothetical protein